MGIILQGRFQKIARAMTRNWGVNVVAHATKCSTNGTDTIWYPANTDHLSKESQNAVHGLLDHEILHVVEEKKHKKAGLKTPSQFIRSYSSKKQKMAFNVFEDIRIEKLCEYIGMRENIKALNETTVNLFHGKEHKDLFKALGCAVICEAQGLSTAWLPLEYRPYLDALEDEIADCKSMVHASDAAQLAARMLAKIEETSEELEQELDKNEESERAGGSGDDSSEGARHDDRPNAGGACDGSSEGEQTGDEEPGDCGDGQSDESDGEGAPQSGNADGGTPSADGDAETEEGSKSAGATSDGKDCQYEGEERKREEPSKAEVRDAIASARRDASSVDVHDDVKQQIEYQATNDANFNNRYIPNPYALEKDTWEAPEVSGTREKGLYTAERNVVASQIRGLKGKLLSLLRARTDCVTTTGHKRGKLDHGKLARVIAGNSNVCKRTEEGEDFDTAVSILIDLSGSMGSGTSLSHKARYAKLVAISLSETLEALQTPFETLGFHNKTWGNVRVAPGTQRCEPIEYVIFKSFKESYGMKKLRLNTITGAGNNVDGESVMAAAERLAVRPEKRKILMVISDGQPHGGSVDARLLDKHLKEVVTQITKFGIEVIAFGIKTEAVERYYNESTGAHSVVIHSLDAMVVDVYIVMKKVFLKRG